MNEEETSICLAFKDNLISMLEDIRDAATCIIPLGKYDKKIIGDGITDLESFIEKIKSADTLRDLNQYIDVNKYLRESGEIEKKLQHHKVDNGFLDFMESVQKLSHGEE